MTNPEILHDGRLISPYPVRTGVVVEDGLAFFGASLLPWRPSLLCAIDASSGTLDTRAGTWVREHAGGLTLEGAMLATDDTLIVPQGRVAPLLFGRATGNALGSLPGGGGSFCLLTEDDEVLHGPGNKAGWITASASDSRAQVASYDKGRAMVIEGSTAWLLSDRALSALDGAARTLQWTHAVERPLTLIKAGGTLVVGADGGLVARRASDGELLFQAELDGRVHGLAVAGGWLYASTDTGALVAYSPTAEPRDFDEPLAADSSLGAPPSLQSMSTEALIARFAFQSDTAVGSPPAAFENLVSDGLRAVAQGPLTLAPAGALHAAELDGHGGDLLVGSDFRDSPMPERELTVEAWARVDAPTTWGGFIGAAQDNGEYERGWLLGYREDRFGFALAGDEGSGRLEEKWIGGATHGRAR